jgi:hypothetical protein
VFNLTSENYTFANEAICSIRECESNTLLAASHFDNRIYVIDRENKKIVHIVKSY